MARPRIHAAPMTATERSQRYRAQRNATKHNETQPADPAAIRAAEEYQEGLEELNRQRKELFALRKEAEARIDAANRMARGISPMMTKEEFKMIRSLLHPDRHPEETEKWNHAFEVFNRLLTTINPHIPIAVLRERGWAPPKEPRPKKNPAPSRHPNRETAP